MKKRIYLLIPLLCWMPYVTANTLTIKIYKTVATGQGDYVGSVKTTDTKYGLLLEPHLKNLTPGLHGFHVHQNPSCDNNGNAAGGHLDPQKTGKHLGPYTDRGHLGDLPALFVENDGTATLPVIAPRLKTSDLSGHSLMIHSGGDNYSDMPKKLGGGGARMECGVMH